LFFGIDCKLISRKFFNAFLAKVFGSLAPAAAVGAAAIRFSFALARTSGWNDFSTFTPSTSTFVVV